MQNRSWMRTLGLALLSLWVALAVVPTASADPGRQPRGASRHQAKVIRKLPPQHVKVMVGKKPFYIHAGVFYHRGSSGYSVVRGPVGARLKVLPRGHRTIVIGGLDYFVYFGTYYRYFPEDRVYVVVAPPVEQLDADVITLLDGESLVGRFVGGNKTSVRFEVDGEIHHVPISEIVAIHFEPPG